MIFLNLIIQIAYAQNTCPLSQKVDSLISIALQKKAFPGCIVYFSHQGTPFLVKSYGFHTYDSLIPVSTADVYDLASLTKVMGATLALMKLYDMGLIHLEDPINKYVHGLGKPIGAITIRAALAHQAGLYPWIPYYKKLKKKNGKYKSKTLSTYPSDVYNFSMTDSLYIHKDFYSVIKKMIRKSELSKDKRYKYSGLFFYLVPEIVETVSGMDFETFLLTNFYIPMKTQTLLFNPLNKLEKSNVVPTELDDYFRNTLIHGTVHDEGAILMKGISGNAGLFGNVLDIAKIWHMWLNGGMYDSIRYLLPTTIDLFTTVQYPNNNNRRGLGFDKPLLNYDPVKSSTAQSASRSSYGHSGFTGPITWADPENEMLFIFLSNRVHPTRDNRVIYEMNLRPTLHQFMYEHLKKYGKPCENE